MKSIFKKELQTFFGSITGYLVIAIFLILNALFLWIFPGTTNIAEGQMASMKGFFELAPWIFLFLIPAITMRMFAEERRTGTFDLLLTRPQSNIQIVVAKFLASLCLVVVALIPTLLHVITVYKLGSPVGNIDLGATWGSYAGLILLAAVYVSLGLLASTITTNQVVAFLFGAIFCYTFYIGFEYIASTTLPLSIQKFFIELGLNEHYLSMSRGVIDTRDLAYFVGVCLIFIVLSAFCISPYRKQQTRRLALQLIIIATGTIALSHMRIHRFDLTSEKRYSITEASESVLAQMKEPIVVEIYLAGKLPAAMQQLQDAVIEKIEDFNAHANRRIFYEVYDIYTDIPADQRQQFIQNITQAGIQPIDLRLKTDDGQSNRLIYPGLIVRTNKRAIAVNILSNNQQLSHYQNVNNSIEMIEYELTKSIHALAQVQKPTIAFVLGHHEANPYDTGDLRLELRNSYNIVNASCKELFMSDTITTAIIGDPQLPFSEEDKFYLDQFIMRGGSVLFAVNPVQVSLDSLSRGMTTLAFPLGHELDDMLFRYGARLNTNLIQDTEAKMLPVNTAQKGQASNYVPAPWYYAPLALPNQKHPIGRNLNRVSMNFVSSIDFVGNNQDIRKSVILASSNHTRSLQTPMSVSLRSIDTPPEASLFNLPSQNFGVILEGSFQSIFRNRIISSYDLNGREFMEQGKPGKIAIFSDGDVLINTYRERDGKVQFEPLGYDRFSKQTFGNKSLMVNTISYLSDDVNLMSLRSRVVKMRLLDKMKYKTNKSMINTLHIVIPIVLIALLGLIFTIYRRRKYTRTPK